MEWIEKDRIDGVKGTRRLKTVFTEITYATRLVIPRLIERR